MATVPATATRTVNRNVHQNHIGTCAAQTSMLGGASGGGAAGGQMSSGGNGGSSGGGLLGSGCAGDGGGASGCPANTEETASPTPSTAPVTASSADSKMLVMPLQHKVMRLRGKSLASSIVWVPKKSGNFTVT